MQVASRPHRAAASAASGAVRSRSRFSFAESGFDGTPDDRLPAVAKRRIVSEPLRVLSVEDNEADTVLALRELKRAGLNCVGRRVDTEEEYRRQLDHFRPDVILSDFAMPRFDGMAALTIARESFPDVPFIFLSGTIGEEYAIRALKSGATDYVLKENLIRLPPAVERAINEAKRLAAQRDIEERQRKIERRFRALIENSSEAVMLTGSDGSVLYASPATVRILGYVHGDRDGRNGFELIHPQDLPDWTARLDAASKNPGKPIPFQCRVRHKDDRGGCSMGLSAISREIRRSAPWSSISATSPRPGAQSSCGRSNTRSTGALPMRKAFRRR